MAITPGSQYYSAAEAILSGLNAPKTAAGVNLLVAWMGLEQGWNASFQCHNPMNTTWKMPGSKSINSVGVQCYASWSQGAQATINTLTQGSPSYMTLVNAIKNGDAGQFFSQSGRQELSVWSGGSSTYANTIYQIYTELAPVPANVLTTSSATATSASSLLGNLSSLFGLDQFDSSTIKTPQQALGLALTGAVILGLLWAGGDDIGL